MNNITIDEWHRSVTKGILAVKLSAKFGTMSILKSHRVENVFILQITLCKYIKCTRIRHCNINIIHCHHLWFIVTWCGRLGPLHAIHDSFTAMFKFLTRNEIDVFNISRNGCNELYLVTINFICVLAGYFNVVQKKNVFCSVCPNRISLMMTINSRNMLQ